MNGVNDKKRFAVVMFWLAKKYETKQEPIKLQDDWINDYFYALSDLRIEDIENGAKFYYSRNEFFPYRPASLRKFVDQAPRPKIEYVSPRALLPEVTPEKAAENLENLNKVLASIGIDVKFGGEGYEQRSDSRRKTGHF